MTPATFQKGVNPVSTRRASAKETCGPPGDVLPCRRDGTVSKSELEVGKQLTGTGIDTAAGPCYTALCCKSLQQKKLSIPTIGQRAVGSYADPSTGQCAF